MAAAPASKARLKLTAVGGEKVLLLRFVGQGHFVESQFPGLLREAVPAERRSFDGDVWRIRGEAAIKRVVQTIRQSCDAVYDPNLMRSGPEALPNPWPIPAEPLRDPADRSIAYMARVWHPRMAEALAFQLPRYDDDFLMAFRRRLDHARGWREYRRDLQIWTVADHYEPLAHDVLDEFYDCHWDPLLGGDEWNVLPPPRDTQYPIRTLTDQEFRTLGVSWGAPIWEIQEAYLAKKEDYNANRIDAGEWYEVDTAMTRIERHYRPPARDESMPEQVAARRDIVLALRQVFATEPERVAWYHGHQGALRGVPAELARTDDGADQVLRVLQIMLALQPRAH